MAHIQMMHAGAFIMLWFSYNNCYMLRPLTTYKHCAFIDIFGSKDVNTCKHTIVVL